MTLADLWTAMPLLILACGALVTLLAGAVARNDRTAYWLASATTLATAFWSLKAPLPLAASTMGITATGLTRLFTLFFCLMAFAVLALSREYNSQCGARGEEYPATVLFTTFGMTALAASTNLMTLFLGLEAMTFGFYILVTHDLKRETAGAAGMIYLLTGVLSSAFMAFGIALLYAASGTLTISDAVRLTLTNGAPPPIALAGWSFLLIGLAFKLSLVPAHIWTPDVYAGAPPPVTAFLSGGSKGAAVLLLLTLLPQTGDSGILRLPFWWFALLSMLIGNVTALRESSVKRMLGCSSIAHMGYVALALVAGPGDGYRAAAYYAIAYGAISLAAFGAITALERHGCGAELDDYRGLGTSQPFLSAILALAMLALAGIPPTAGFTGKFMIFASAIRAGEMPLALLGIITVALSIFFYLRIVAFLYFKTGSTQPCSRPNLPEYAVLTAASLLVLFLGIWPSPLIAFLHTLLP